MSPTLFKESLKIVLVEIIRIIMPRIKIYKEDSTMMCILKEVESNRNCNISILYQQYKILNSLDEKY